MEVESEFANSDSTFMFHNHHRGGDDEILTTFARESGIERKQVAVGLFDLTSDKKSFGPIVEKVTESSNLRSIQLSVSGTGLDHRIKRYTIDTNILVGIDRAIVRLYRLFSLRHDLNETSQISSPLFSMTIDNITKAYQELQLYNDYDGSYSFVYDKATKHSSLYLTTSVFGAMISPMMPFHDNATLNRRLNWILSHPKEDGSFDDNGPCFHYQFSL